MSCKAGEVVVVLGEESSGKTRLLTAVGEILASPTKSSRSTILARGKILVGGVESSQWSPSELKRKAGVLFNDMQALSDVSQLHSGSSLHDILRPTGIGRNHEGAIRSAVETASEFTGLSKKIIPRLPQNLDTIVTANEDDLKNRNQEVVLLSKTEWAKVLLTKVIAQTLLDNDNSMASPNSVSKSLVGSILLLDDVTNYLNEIEEIQFIKSLKSSGAASIITSKRWAIGRFADKIVVMKNGSVVERGTHSELMEKGSDNSLYASQWAQIMLQ